jgi:hypothetical protein
MGSSQVVLTRPAGYSTKLYSRLQPSFHSISFTKGHGMTKDYFVLNLIPELFDIK